MIEYIKGTIAYKTSTMVIVENNGIGYQLLSSTRTLDNAGNKGDKVEIFTQMIVKEDSMTLYGFSTREEREMFNKIISVSGIGPKIALGVLSSMTTADLAIALVTEDVKSITKIKGIGPKTAKRMILELKEKVDNDELKSAMSQDFAPERTSITNEAIQALMALGFSSVEASKAVSRVNSDVSSVEELITAALRTRGA